MNNHAPPTRSHKWGWCRAPAPPPRTRARAARQRQQAQTAPSAAFGSATQKQQKHCRRRRRRRRTARPPTRPGWAAPPGPPQRPCTARGGPGAVAPAWGGWRGKGGLLNQQRSRYKTQANTSRGLELRSEASQARREKQRRNGPRAPRRAWSARASSSRHSRPSSSSAAELTAPAAPAEAWLPPKTRRPRSRSGAPRAARVVATRERAPAGGGRRTRRWVRWVRVWVRLGAMGAPGWMRLETTLNIKQARRHAAGAAVPGSARFGTAVATQQRHARWLRPRHTHAPASGRLCVSRRRHRFAANAAAANPHSGRRRGPPRPVAGAPRAKKRREKPPELGPVSVGAHG